MVPPSKNCQQIVSAASPGEPYILRNSYPETRSPRATLWRSMGSGQQSSMATVGVRREAQLAWLALVLTPGMGITRTWKVMRRLSLPERLFEASLTDLEGLGMPAHS